MTKFEMRAWLLPAFVVGVEVGCYYSNYCYSTKAVVVGGTGNKILAAEGLQILAPCFAEVVAILSHNFPI